MMLLDWLSTAKRGDEFHYYTGHLAHERHEAAAITARKEVVPHEVRARLDAANDAWRAYERKECTLIQRRVGPVGDFCWQYVAVKS